MNFGAYRDFKKTIKLYMFIVVQAKRNDNIFTDRFNINFQTVISMLFYSLYFISLTVFALQILLAKFACVQLRGNIASGTSTIPDTLGKISIW